MVKALRIGQGFTLGLEVVTESVAILARKGRGKTYTAGKFAEEMRGAGCQIVVLDPTGAWWGLRSSAAGDGAGLDVYIFGGEHRDLPLEPRSAELIADTLVETGQSAILDLSDMRKTAMREFVTLFLERLYQRKSAAQYRTPLHVFIDEADLFAPQRVQSGQERMLGAVEDIVRRGRLRGLGSSLVSQRPQVVNKDVLTQCELLVCGQLVHKLDRKAVEDWVVEHDDGDRRDVFLDGITRLERGQFWFWSPAVFKVFQLVQVEPKWTYDSSRTPEVGEVLPSAELKPLDIESLGAQMRTAAEEAVANDPARLRARIRELETATQRQREPSEWEGLQDELREARDTAHRQADRIAKLVAAGLAAMQDADQMGKRLEVLLQPAAEGQEDRPSGSEPAVDARAPRAQGSSRAAVPDSELGAKRQDRQAATSVPRPPAPDLNPAADINGVRIGKGERTVMDVLAEYPDGRTYDQLAFLAGYSVRASTLGVILANLRRGELVEPGNQPVRLTPAGLDAAGGPRERPRGLDLLDQWLRHPRMGEGERKVLTALIDLYPDEPSHADLCDRTGYSPTASTMGVIMSKLRKLGLVERGRRRVAPDFIEAIA